MMKPLFGGPRAGVDDRNELARLRLYVKQLEARVDSGVSSSYEEESRVETLLKVHFSIFFLCFTNRRFRLLLFIGDELFCGFNLSIASLCYTTAGIFTNSIHT